MKTKKKAGFGAILAGLVLLANPCVHIIDVLPDFFGMLLILFGMRKVGDIESHCALSKQNMKRALWVALGKLGAMLLALVTSFLDTNMMLIFAMCGGILDCIFFIPAMRELISGTGYLYLSSTEKSLESRETELSVMTAVFVVAKSVLSCVPVMIPLFEIRLGDVSSGLRYVDTAALKILLTVLCAFIALLLGVVWLVSAFGYFGVLSRDEAFCTHICEKYETDVLQNGRVMRERSVKNYFSVLTAAVILLFCIRFDVYYFSFSFLFGVAAATLPKLSGKLFCGSKTKFYALCIVQSISGLVGFILLYKYCDAYGGYLNPCEVTGFASAFVPCVIAEAVSLIALCLLFIEKRRTEVEMCRVCVGFGDELPGREELDRELRGRIIKKINAAVISAVVYCAASLACTFLIPLGDSRDIFALSWLVRSCFALALTLRTSGVSSALREEVEK